MTKAEYAMAYAFMAAFTLIAIPEDGTFGLPNKAPDVAAVTAETPKPFVLNNWGTPSKAEAKAHAARIACMQNPYCDTFGQISKPPRQHATPSSSVTVNNVFHVGARGRRRHR